MAKAKGTTLIGLVKLMRRSRARAQGLLPERLHHYLDERISSAAWYPEEDLVDLIRTALRLLPEPAADRLREMGEFAARSHLSGVYADLVGRTSLSTATHALWTTQHDSGALTVLRESPGLVRYELTGFAYPTRELCAVNCGYFAESYRLAGTAGVKVEHDVCCAVGGDRCIWTVRWKAS
jgi:hypothetical protein